MKILSFFSFVFSKKKSQIFIHKIIKWLIAIIIGGEQVKLVYFGFESELFLTHNNWRLWEASVAPS